MRYKLLWSVLGVLAIVFMVPLSGGAKGQSLLSAVNFSHGTSINEKQATFTLKEVLDVLEDQYQVRFNYNSDLIKAKTIDSKQLNGLGGKDVDQSLRALLFPLGLTFEELGTGHYIIRPVDEAANRFITKTNPARAVRRSLNTLGLPAFLDLRVSLQEGIVTGIVTGEDGAPLPGVTVEVRATQIGASTDLEGRYRLENVPEGAVLEISFIGYKTTEVPVGGRTTINITLEPDLQSLEEVVVVGYGTQKKSVVTGAISSVKASDLENQQIGRLEQALQGRTSGLTIASSSGAPGSPATVRVRGTTSLNSGASNPLYVVDGIVVDNGGIDYLNPSDIESIEVLKDAASAAIYGARSSAGVILVTTKKGTAGGLRLNYNGYFGLQSPAKKLDLLNAEQYATLRNEQEVNAGGDIVYDDPASLGSGTDWQSYVFNDNARVQNHEVSISGGSERSTFYSSFGIFDQEGIVASDISHFKRYNIRLNSNHKIKDWLTIGQTLGYSHIKNKGSVGVNTDFGGPLSGAIMLDPITPAVVTDPDEAAKSPYANQPVMRDAAGNPYGISSEVQQQVTNPLAYIKTRQGNFNWSDDIVGNVFAEATPIKGLKLRSTLGTRLTYWGSETFTPLYYLNSNQLSTQTSFSRDKRQMFNWNLENTISYGRTAGLHDFTVLLGQGAYLDNNSSFLDVTYFNLPVDNFDDASMNYATAAEDITAEGREGIQHTVTSLFGRLTYNYGGKYLFTGILRRDGSSRFGTNNKYGYFPSASVGWVVSEEDFLPSTTTLNFLKIRGSYGVTGNDVLGNFRYLATVGGDRNYIFGDDIYHIGYSPDAPANPDLRWEETTQLNLGFDAVLFQHWNLTFDWYNKKTSGILQVVELPGYVGATGASYGNVADMENRGVELELAYHKQLGKLDLRVNANASYLKNEVTFLGDGKEFLKGDASIHNASYEINRIALGHAIGAFYGFKTMGIFQNQAEVDAYTGPEGQPIQPEAVPGDFRWADLDKDGQITENDRTFIGDPTPDWSYGLTLNLKYRAFDLLLFGQGVAGNQIFQGLRRLDIPTANWQSEALGRWRGEGTSDNYPRLTISDDNKNFTNPSDFHLENGDYFRIKTFQIGYSLPGQLISRAGLQRARVYLSSNNLFTLTGYTGYDPEIGGGVQKYGVDRAIYPQARSFMLGVNVGF